MAAIRDSLLRRVGFPPTLRFTQCALVADRHAEPQHARVLQPSSIFAGMLSLDLICSSSSRTRTPSRCSRAASSRTAGLSLAL